MNRSGAAAILSLLLVFSLHAENFRTMVAGKLAVSALALEGASISLSYIDSVVIVLEGDRRFVRGIELDIRVPQQYLKYRGSLAASFYAPIKPVPAEGVADLEAERVGFEMLPNKLQAIFHVPVRKNHGLKASPYVSIPTTVVPPASFPLLFRLMPVIKGLPEELETLQFKLFARPILAEEGALRVVVKYPEKLKDKAFTLLIDDVPVPEPGRELVLSPGEHTLVVASEFYRNENRRILIEKAKTLEMVLELEDPTPIVTIEAPENAKVFFDNVLISDPRKPFPCEPGDHEIRFLVGDYSLVRPVTVQRGRNYRMSLSIDALIEESE